MVAVAAVAALVVVLTRPGGTPSGKAGGEIFLQPAAATGPDPFTESTAADQGTQPPQSPPARTPGTSTPSATAPGTTVTRSVTGAAPGLYGGTKDVASCDVEKQIRVLSAQPSTNEAFASALSLRPAAVAHYLRSLTPLQLRVDTRVTNHGYRDGKPTAYQAVLQAETAVLVDDRGVPRVRCACGNPLTPPVALGGQPKRTGRPWPSFQPSRVVVIAPSVTVVNKFVIYDRHDGRWVERDRNDHQGEHDKAVPPPVVKSPPPSSQPLPVSPPQSPPTSQPAQSPASPPSAPESPASPPSTPESPASPAPPPESPPAPPPVSPAPGTYSGPPSEPALPGSSPGSSPGSPPGSSPDASSSPPVPGDGR
ncbi:hypothetical protein OHA81_04735 [Streptomyces sp. NBC_00667]|nr:MULTISPECIES: DUF6777 domain-containing protein [unclassified Streptomyces]WUC67660.1 hypothetical protein OG861_27475 [Streptomyces sp. NBC_00539]